MSGMITYPVATPDLGDLVLGTQIKEDGNLTKNFGMDAMRQLFAANTSLKTVPALYAPSSTTNKIATVGGSNKVNFGSAQTTPYISLVSQGAATFLQKGLYKVTVHGNFAAYNATVFPCVIMFRAELNNTQLEETNIVSIQNATSTFSQKYIYIIEAEQNDVIQFYIGGATGTSTGGGLYLSTATNPSFAPSAPATLTIELITTV